jgi:hypothetical protein
MTQTVILLPVMIILVISLFIITLVSMNLRFKARKLEHDEIVKAIESGQDLPELKLKKPEADFMGDMRKGILWLASGTGIFLFFIKGDNGMSEVAGIGFIPMFVGLALIAISLISKYMSEKPGDE